MSLVPLERRPASRASGRKRPNGARPQPVLGSTTPRLWTPPLRKLTRKTSYGFSVVDFAAELGRPLDPWQEWLAIHGCELLPNGRPRFRKVLVLAARQNGKTELPVILSLYWQFVEAVPLILGTSSKLNYARESWVKAVQLAESCADLDELRPKRWKRETNGEQESWTVDRARYLIAAANDDAGRSLTVHRLILDELRQHHTWDCWNAAVPAGNAVPDFQAWCMTNAGDDRSVVLNETRDAALDYIRTGKGDPMLGIFEWSCEPGDDPQDLRALAKANPNLGRRILPETLLGDAAKAVQKGGDVLTGFQTEQMCIRVPKMLPAIPPAHWAQCFELGDLAGARSRIACCLDIAPDGLHATLAAAAVMPDGRVRLELAAAWEDTEKLRRELGDWLRRIRPQAFGWLPGGPAAALTADLKVHKGPRRNNWPPRGITVEEIRGDVKAVCMALADLAKTAQLVHAGDPLLDAQIAGAERLKRGDGWVFARGEETETHVDACYAGAGAVQLARTLPPPLGKPRVVTVPD